MRDLGRDRLRGETGRGEVGRRWEGRPDSGVGGGRARTRLPNSLEEQESFIVSQDQYALVGSTIGFRETILCQTLFCQALC